MQFIAWHIQGLALNLPVHPLQLHCETPSTDCSGCARSFLLFTNAHTFMCQLAASWSQPPRVASDRTVSVLLGPSMKREESSPAAQQSRAKTHTFRG